MNDRVRIYELARQMGLENEEVITAMRELGYDVKSHSSTIDKTAVGLLIPHINKKKQQQQEKAKPAPTKASSPGKPLSKATVPPPAPPKVKPRVIGRYQKPGAEPAVPAVDPNQVAPAAPVETSAPVEVQHAEPVAQVAQPAAQAPAPAAQTAPLTPASHSTQPAQTSLKSATASATQPAQAAGGAQAEKQSHSAPTPEPAQPVAQTATQAPAAASVKPPEPTSQAPSAPTAPIERTVSPAVAAQQQHAAAMLAATTKSNEAQAARANASMLAQNAQAKTANRSGNGQGQAEPATSNRTGDNAKSDSQGSDTAAETNEKPKDKEDAQPRGQAVRPMTPSVPVRVAAPSVRATPPRPPKSHRQTPAERHSSRKDEKARPTAAPVEIPKIITLTTNLTVKDLSEKMNAPVEEIIKRMMTKGVFRTVNQMVELEIMKDLAVEMEYEVLTEEFAETPEVAEAKPELSEEEQAALITRPPVVTIMGHVDHGKTSLLDAIRQTKFLLTDSEAGGITQHIGAYHVEVKQKDGPDRQIVFLDTPGHEAFTAMRARGAKATDIAILVVAADDGVMPQTIEAIDHVKAAGVPLVVAVNKIDKAGADPDKVLNQLMEHGVLSDRFGGDTVTCNVSAKKREGLEELLEMILLVADILDLKANPDKLASGVIIEAEKSRQKGAVVTALVENGTLREGDIIVAGVQSGRVKALSDDHGRRVKAAGPSMPVEVLGLDEVPMAGDKFEVVADLAASKVLLELNRATYGDRKSQHVTLESLHDLLERGEVRDLNVIVKADVQGTAEAIAEQIRKLSGNEVQVRVLRTASGDISENDVNLAASSNAIVIGFNVQPDMNARNVAEVQGVDIRTYSIIYQITDDLEKAIQGLIQPLRQEMQIGTAEIRQIFKFGKNLTIAGCMVIDGKIQRNGIVKIDRGGQIVYEGKLDTLKRFKDDAREVAQGFECGMSFEKFSDLQEGDKVHCFIIQETKREITRS
jgi:translation initiation factor IF-2